MELFSVRPFACYDIELAHKIVCVPVAPCSPSSTSTASVAIYDHMSVLMVEEFNAWNDHLRSLTQGLSTYQDVPSSDAA